MQTPLHLQEFSPANHRRRCLRSAVTCAQCGPISGCEGADVPPPRLPSSWRTEAARGAWTEPVWTERTQNQQVRPAPLRSGPVRTPWPPFWFFLVRQRHAGGVCFVSAAAAGGAVLNPDTAAEPEPGPQRPGTSLSRSDRTGSGSSESMSRNVPIFRTEELKLKHKARGAAPPAAAERNYNHTDPARLQLYLKHQHWQQLYSLYC